MALSGAAVVRMRSMACSMLSVILLVPMNRTTCSGPKVMPDTRFPTMSTLTSWPWRVRAFVPVTNKSARRAWRRQYVFWARLYPSWKVRMRIHSGRCSISERMPVAFIVSESPHEIVVGFILSKIS